MNDRPTAVELLRAVEHFLEEDVVSSLDGVKRYHARVAANVVAIVAREIETEDDHLRADWESLSSLLRAGEADSGPWRRRVLTHLRETVAAKLEVAKPTRKKRN